MNITERRNAIGGEEAVDEETFKTLEAMHDLFSAMREAREREERRQRRITIWTSVGFGLAIAAISVALYFVSR